MNIKQLLAPVAALIAGAVLPSCGVGIPMEYNVPGKISLKKGSKIGFHRPSGENMATREITWALSDTMGRDGYYKPANVYHGGCSADIWVRATETEKYYQGQLSYVQVNADVVVDNGNRRVYSRSFSRSAYPSDASSSGINYESPAYSIARTVIRDLRPHSVSYTERVRGNDENPYIEKGARECAAGNWSTGRAYALKAIETNPADAEAYFLMGLIERNAHNFKKSSEYFSKANAIKPSGKYTAAIKKNNSISTNEARARKQLRG